MKYGVVLGGSKFQEGLITHLNNNNLQAIVLDKNPNCYLSEKNVNFIECDISKPNECLSAIKDKDITCCFTAQSDIGVPSQGLINSYFNLIGVNYEQALITSNKFLFRENMKKYNIKQPKYHKCKNQNDLYGVSKIFGFPFIIKPVDSSGSRGVQIIENLDEIETKINNTLKYSRSDYFLAEEFINGVEYGAQTISTNGQLNYCFLHTDWTINNIPVGHCFPICKKLSLEKKLYEITKSAIRALGYTGPSNVDLIVDKDENVYVLEIGARIGATCLPDLIKHSTGIDLYEKQVQIAVGKLILKEEYKYLFQNAGVRILSSSKSFKVSNFNYHEFLKSKDKIKEKYSLKEIELEINSNLVVPALNSGVDRFGFISMISNELNANQIERKLNKINEIILNKLSKSI